MGHSREPSAHWNSYRPTYSLPVRENRHRPGPNNRTPAHHATTSSYDHASTPPPDAYAHDTTNPNTLPITPRYFSSYTSPLPHPTESENNSHAHPQPFHALPQIWNPALDTLMGRATRAYDLVINYARDSDGGTRWSARDIARIHDAGMYLHANIRALKAWQRCAAGEWDYVRMQEDEDVVREMCEVVLGMIGGMERKMAWEGGMAVEQHGGDEDMHMDDGDRRDREQGKMDTDMVGVKRRREADWREKPQKKAKGTKRRQSPRRQDGEGDAAHSNGRIAGRLGNHVMHY